MRVVRLWKTTWDVLLVENADGETVWEFLEKDPRPPSERMRALIRRVAQSGPPRDPQKSAALREGLFEFKTGAKKGPKLRVFWFYDKGKVIICTHGVWKREAVPTEIDKAIATKKRYFNAQRQKRLSIETRGAS
jgi:putative component of toxin-antitoxin plasmid stabilization module